MAGSDMHDALAALVADVGMGNVIDAELLEGCPVAAHELDDMDAAIGLRGRMGRSSIGLPRVARTPCVVAPQGQPMGDCTARSRTVRKRWLLR